MDNEVQSEPESRGSGEDYVRGPTADTRLVERAIRERWPIPPEARETIATNLASIAKNAKASHRNRAIAARILVQMDALNMEQEKRDLQMGGEMPMDGVNININQQQIVLSNEETGETLDELEQAGIITVRREAIIEAGGNGNGKG